MRRVGLAVATIGMLLSALWVNPVVATHAGNWVQSGCNYAGAVNLNSQAVTSHTDYCADWLVASLWTSSGGGYVNSGFEECNGIYWPSCIAYGPTGASSAFGYHQVQVGSSWSSTKETYAPH
jgi:hypothetical protein